jgi:hypothetical protein
MVPIVEKEREGKTAAVRRRNLDGELFISINVSLAASMNSIPRSACTVAPHQFSVDIM